MLYFTNKGSDRQSVYLDQFNGDSSSIKADVFYELDDLVYDQVFRFKRQVFWNDVINTALMFASKMADTNYQRVLQEQKIGLLTCINDTDLNTVVHLECGGPDDLERLVSLNRLTFIPSTYVKSIFWAYGDDILLAYKEQNQWFFLYNQEEVDSIVFSKSL